MNQNDVDRRGGMDEAYLTRSMLTRLAATLRSRQGGNLANELPTIGGDIDENAGVVVDDNCTVCFTAAHLIEQETNITFVIGDVTMKMAFMTWNSGLFCYSYSNPF